MLASQIYTVEDIERSSLTKSYSIPNLNQHRESVATVAVANKDFFTPHVKSYALEPLQDSANNIQIQPYHIEPQTDGHKSIEYPWSLYGRQSDEKLLRNPIFDASFKSPSLSPLGAYPKLSKLSSPTGLQNFALSPTNLTNRLANNIREIKDSSSYVNAMKALQAKIRTLESESTREREVNEELKETLNKKLDALKAKIEGNQIENLNAEKRNEARIQKIQAELDKKEQEVEDLSQENANFKDNIARLENEKDNEQHVSSIERNQLRNKVAELEHRLNLEKAKHDELSISEKQLIKHRNELQNTFDELQEKHLKLEKAMREHNLQFEWQISELKGKNLQLEKIAKASQFEKETESQNAYAREKDHLRKIETLSAERSSLALELTGLRALQRENEYDIHNKQQTQTQEREGFSYHSREKTKNDRESYSKHSALQNRLSHAKMEEGRENAYPTLVSKPSAQQMYSSTKASKKEFSTKRKTNIEKSGLLNDSLSEGFTSLEIERKSPVNLQNKVHLPVDSKSRSLTPSTKYDKLYSLYTASPEAKVDSLSNQVKSKPFDLEKDQNNQLDNAAPEYIYNMNTGRSHGFTSRSQANTGRSQGYTANTFKTISDLTEIPTNSGEGLSSARVENYPRRSSFDSPDKNSQMGLSANAFHFEYQRSEALGAWNQTHQQSKPDEFQFVIKSIVLIEKELLDLSKEYQRQNTDLMIGSTEDDDNLDKRRVLAELSGKIQVKNEELIRFKKREEDLTRNLH